MRRALLTMIAALTIAVVPGPADAQAPLQSRVWMIPLQQDGANEQQGQRLHLTITNLSASPAHVTFRHYGASGLPQPRGNFNGRYFGGESVGQVIEAGATKAMWPGDSGMTATFTLVLSDEPITIVAYANRVTVGGRIDYVRTTTLAFDCHGGDAQTFACHQPLTAMMPPLPL
jgi:hypothetical protein